MDLANLLFALFLSCKGKIMILTFRAHSDKVDDDANENWLMLGLQG